MAEMVRTEVCTTSLLPCAANIVAFRRDGRLAVVLRLIQTYHAMPLPCRVLRESPRVAGKRRTANRETPRGSRKKPNLGRSLTGRRETADVNPHVPCRAVPWP